MSLSGRSQSPAKRAFADPLRSSGGGAAASFSGSKKARYEGEDEGEGEGAASVYETDDDDDEEEGGAPPSSKDRRVRRALLAGRRKATPAEILAKKTQAYAAAMSARTTAHKDTNKARKAVEDFVQQNTGFVADAMESARSTLEDLKEEEQVTLLNSLSKGLDVRLFWRNACARGAHFFTSTPNPPPATHTRAHRCGLPTSTPMPRLRAWRKRLSARKRRWRPPPRQPRRPRRRRRRRPPRPRRSGNLMGTVWQ